MCVNTVYDFELRLFDCSFISCHVMSIQFNLLNFISFKSIHSFVHSFVVLRIAAVNIKGACNHTIVTCRASCNQVASMESRSAVRWQPFECESWLTGVAAVAGENLLGMSYPYAEVRTCILFHGYIYLVGLPHLLWYVRAVNCSAIEAEWTRRCVINHIQINNKYDLGRWVQAEICHLCFHKVYAGKGQRGAPIY